ncbi:hypothetical protein PH213_37200 [Streptomyces sp. SRF1]|uniref:alpha/beta hydrolase n=1 Tax=Streptomyces sp. SRF1 TaxID=1549642 RepID=UPI0025AF471D|nr:hypothetical protein [Streptomyces sp. SRF1]MDN3060058.1 hypothetical protein [Streptomyces sp. SRF1]
MPTSPESAVLAVTGAEIDTSLSMMADQYALSPRSPIMRTPASQGLAYDDISFEATDGTPLEGWYVPAPDSDKLVIVNHPRWFSRSGLPAHLEPWKSIGAYGGNDFEVDFIPDVRVLHDAGYNVLTYDLRNFGHSGSANGGLTSNGIFEARDVLGSLRYVRDRSDLRDMAIGLFSRCLGCAGTIFAMRDDPVAFDGVRCLVGCQPLSVRVILQQALVLAGIPDHHIDRLDELIRLRVSFSLDEMSPLRAIGSVQLPTLLYQVRDDVMTRAEDVQSMYDALPVRDKRLLWIEGTTRRWDGYTYFQRNPREILDWLHTHMN